MGEKLIHVEGYYVKPHKRCPPKKDKGALSRKGQQEDIKGTLDVLRKLGEPPRLR